MAMRIGLYKAHTGIRADANIINLMINSLPKNLRWSANNHIKKCTSELFDPIKLSRNIIFATYLHWRLKCSFEEAFSLVESGVGFTPFSVDSFQETIETLFDIGFDKKMVTIQKH